jgi:hypothetical protein
MRTHLFFMELFMNTQAALARISRWTTVDWEGVIHSTGTQEQSSRIIGVYDRHTGRTEEFLDRSSLYS